MLTKTFKGSSISSYSRTYYPKDKHGDKWKKKKEIKCLFKVLVLGHWLFKSLELHWSDKHHSSKQYFLSCCFDGTDIKHWFKISLRLHSSGLRSCDCEGDSIWITSFFSVTASSNHSMDPCALWMGVILEEKTPNRIKRFHYRIKVISQKNFVWICNDSKGPKPCQ